MRAGPSAPRRPRSPAARLFDAVAVLVVGGVIVGAALVPALTASTESATTVEGDVKAGGGAVAGIDIGFWSPVDGVIATTSTDDAGRFVLPVATGADGYVYAGTRPDAVEAIATVGRRSLVRGVVGATGNAGITSPLYQGFNAATARNIAGGRPVRFVLQAPGRIVGTSRQLTTPGIRLELQRLDGSVVQALKADGKGRFSTRSVVPGDYRLQVVPRAPRVPATLPVRVPPGRSASVTLPTPRTGATLSGTLTSAGEPVGTGVPVLLLQDEEQVASTTTADGGEYRFPGLAAGAYQVVFGRSPAPSGSASALAGTTADDVQPATATVQVAAALTDVVLDQELAAAAGIRGSVTVDEGASATVLAEDRASHAVVRTATVAADGTFALGGLTAGTAYDVVAVATAGDPAASTWGTATATATEGAAAAAADPGVPADSPASTDPGSTATGDAIELAATRPALTLTGSVSGATTGTVTVGDPAGFFRTGTVDADGTYTVAGLVPGAFPATVQEAGRTASTAMTGALSGSAASTSQNLPRATQPATYKAWFISGGAGVPTITGRAVDADGNEVRFGPTTKDGHVTVGSLAPGIYRYRERSFTGSIAAVDGPWWFGAPTGTFTLRAGATTDVGPVVLHIYAH